MCVKLSSLHCTSTNTLVCSPLLWSGSRLLDFAVTALGAGRRRLVPATRQELVPTTRHDERERERPHDPREHERRVSEGARRQTGDEHTATPTDAGFCVFFAATPPTRHVPACCRAGGDTALECCTLSVAAARRFPSTSAVNFLPSLLTLRSSISQARLQTAATQCA